MWIFFFFENNVNRTRKLILVENWDVRKANRKNVIILVFNYIRCYSSDPKEKITLA